MAGIAFAALQLLSGRDPLPSQMQKGDTGCHALCSEEEALADMNAFNREYENDNSWEQLQEDEYGHLRPLVSVQQ